MITDHTAVDLINVSYGYRPGQDVLEGVNIAIKKSAITAILGKSGSGKSTLIQLINGMIIPREGEVRVHGTPIDYRNIHALRLQMGYVVQHIGLFPHMTIAENISILGKVGNRPRDQVKSRIDELMDMVQLSQSYLNKYPHEISGGEQQRAGLCRALLLRPPILLMDEPFTSLDKKTKQSIYHHLLDIQRKEDITVVIVTHDWDETLALADEFNWIENRSVKACGDRTEVMKLKDTYFSEAD